MTASTARRERPEPSEEKPGLVGQSLARVEDERLITGRGAFLDSLARPGMVHAVMVRSPVAHARIEGIDVEAAKAVSGILGVFTGADLVAGGVEPVPCVRATLSADGTPFHAPVRHAIAVDTVRHVGEPVAMVVAETHAAALDAADLVEVDYDHLPVVTDPLASRETAFVWEKGDAEATAAAFKRAAHVVSARIANPRVLISPLEPRGAIGEYDPESGRYTLYTQTQGVHLVRRLVAPTLAVPPDRLTVVTGDVGGSFGLKLVAFPEQTAVLYAARALGRPVCWIATRSEGWLTDTAGRDHVSDIAVAFDADGRMLGLRVETWGNLGAYPSSLSPSTHTTGFAATLGGPYVTQSVHLRVHGMYTNTAPTDAYRGSGKPESTYILERLLDRAARRLGIDRVELRRRNLVPSSAMPYQAWSGYTFDCGDFEAVLDKGLTLSDWNGFPARRAASAGSGMRRGIGLCLYVHVTGVSAEETSRVWLEPSGKVVVETGIQAAGQSHETTLAQLVAEHLQVPAQAVKIVQGDTRKLPPKGGPTAGSSSLQVGGATVLRAAERMLEKARAAAAEKLEAAAADLVYGQGRFRIVGTDRSIQLTEIASEMASPACAGEAELDGDIVTIPNGAYVCEVEVDPDTGVTRIVRFVGVDDIGRRLNPQVAEGQIHGGIAQGIGQALLERPVYEADSGQFLTGSLMDYALPRADDLPMYDLAAADIPTERNALGMKGVGEIGCIGAPAAVMNAVADAIGHDAIEMPATPEAVWRAINRSGKAAP